MAIEGGHVPLRIGKKRSSSSTWPHHQGSCWGDVLCYQEEWPRPRQEHSPKTHAAARNRRWAAPRSRIPIVNWRRRTQSTFSSSRGLLLFSLLFVGQAAPLLPSLSLVPKTPKGERERRAERETLDTTTSPGSLTALRTVHSRLSPRALGSFSQNSSWICCFFSSCSACVFFTQLLSTRVCVCECTGWR